MNKNNPLNLIDLSKKKQVQDYKNKIISISNQVLELFEEEQLTVYDARMVITFINNAIDVKVNEQILPKLTE
jgi:hypothetical protein